MAYYAAPVFQASEGNLVSESGRTKFEIRRQ